MSTESVGIQITQTPQGSPAILSPSAKSLVARVGTLVSGNVVASAASFLTITALARLLPMADFGRVSYAFNVSTLLTLFLSFGIPNLMVVVCHRDERSIISEINRLALLCICFISPVLVLAAFLCLKWKGVPIVVSVPVLLSAVIGAVVPHVIAICQADGRWSSMSRYQCTANVVRAVLVVAGVAVFRPANYSLAIWLSGMGTAIGAVLVARKERRLLRVASNMQRLRKHFRDFINFALTNSVVVIGARIDVLVAGFLLIPTDLAAYSAASTLALGFGMVQAAVMSVSLHDAASSTHDSPLVFRRMRQLLPMVMLGITIVLVASPIVLPLLLGGRYARAVLPFDCLICTLLMGILFAPVESHFSAFASHAAFFLKIAQLGGFVLMVSVLRHSIEGVAMAVIISRAIGWIGAFTYYCYRRHINNLHASHSNWNSVQSRN